MKIEREKLLDTLRKVSFAVSPKGLIEQSDCLVFQNNLVMAYNGEVKITASGIEGVEGVLPPGDLINLLRKIPDNEVEITQQKNKELMIIGKHKKAAITVESNVCLDVSEVPDPGEWKELPEGVLNHLRRAAETCGTDEAWGAATCVHVTKKKIEASDNFRIFRWTGKTGFREEIFLPAHGVEIFPHFRLRASSINKGWCHFCDAEAIISIRGRQIEQYPEMAEACKVEGTEVVLPAALSRIAHRAEVTAEGEGHAVNVSVELRSGKGRIKSRSARGWYRESFALEYDGPDLSFDVHPQILGEIVEFSPSVIVGKDRMLAVVEEAQLVIALKAQEED